jgi:pimeloyl-ACP methyl ester carboxylesterase
MSNGDFICVNGVTLEAKRWPGRGLPLLLLHEGLGSVAMWRDFPEALATATGHEVIAWSRQSYGASDPLPRPRDPGYMHDEAALLPDVMDALNIDCAHLLGHSDGGSIALIAAARFPARAASLILEAPHVYVEQITVDSIAEVKTTYQTTDLGMRLGRHHKDGDHTFRRWNDIWLDPRFRDWNIEALLPRVTAPALLIQGLDDEYGSLDQLDRIEAVLPHTRRLELARCGHSPHRDQPEAVLTAVTAFLRNIDA